MISISENNELDCMVEDNF